MGINKRHLWKIDEVLDPTSNFWENIDEDMESYIDSLSEEQVKSISAEMSFIYSHILIFI